MVHLGLRKALGSSFHHEIEGIEILVETEGCGDDPAREIDLPQENPIFEGTI